jgi:uncharacterized protein (DUF362 family)
MENTVAVVRGTEKLAAFKEVIDLSKFDDALLAKHQESGKSKEEFSIIIKPNMMVYTNPEAFEPLVTDWELVEYLVDHIRAQGFTNIKVCEAQNDVGRMLKNHNVEFVAERIGYKPNGRYKVCDLTLESKTFHYLYLDKKGMIKRWKDKVGTSWKEADFRVTFAKCKTHEHDWMTLGLKNVYGCMPRADKVAKYHIKSEVFTVTARSLYNFPLHFSFIDAWVGSDGFQGYKICHPQDLKMFLAGPDAVAVDIETFKRAGVDPVKSKFIQEAAWQVSDGVYPEYKIVGDTTTQFSDICKWDNIDDKIVESIDILEEVYISWGIINLKAIAKVVDYNTFPPKNWFYRFLVWLSKKLYGFFKLFKWYRKFYEKKKK